MSIWNSTTLCVEEIEEIMKNTIFDTEEIEALYERFKYLDRTGTGFLTFVEFQMIPEFHSNPFSKLVIKYLERMSLFEKINFITYLDFLSIFSRKTPKSKRISFLFDIFDLDCSKKITKENLREIYFLMAGDDNPESVDCVLKIFDKENKGYLDFDDFAIFYNSDQSLEKNMILYFNSYFSKEEPRRFLDFIWPENKNSKRKHQ